MTHGLNLQIAAQEGTAGPKWLDAVLSDNESIDITLNSQVWDADAGSFSETLSLPIEQNLHILGNLASMRGCDVYRLLWGRRFRLFAEGVLIFYGVIHLDEEVEIKDNAVEIELASSTLEWDDLIADLDCRDVPLKDRIVLGDAISSEQEILFYVDYDRRLRDHEYGTYSGWTHHTNIQSIDRVIFPQLMFPSNINTKNPYPAAKFCNINICWQKEDSGGNKLRGYEVGQYSRTNTSPCFYVLYFFDCLFKYLNISVLRNDLNGVEDLRRLAFVNTACFFDIDKKEPVVRTVNVKDYISLTLNEKTKYFSDIDNELKNIEMHLSDNAFNTYVAVANSKNFPDKDVKSVVSSVLDGIGARLLYNSTDQTAEIVLLRNIFAQQEYEEIPCKITDQYTKQIRKDGFRLKYSETKADKDEDMNDYNRDTMFNYTDYSDVEHATYDSIYLSPRIYDNTCYIDDRTGNAYRVKVDKDAKNARELHPSWFQVGQFCKAEYGDCSNEDYIEEVTIGFSPVLMNVISVEGGYERFAYFVDIDNLGKEILLNQEFTFRYIHAQLAFTPVIISYNWSLSVAVTYKGDAAYNTSESGQNPLNEYENGLTLGFCRGEIPSVSPTDDGEGNEVIVPASQLNNIFHDDSVDSFGNIFDYNGTEEGIGGDSDERISLHLRAEKPDPDYVDTDPESNITYQEARQMILDTFTSAHTDLLNRPSVSKESLRAAGWNIEGDGDVGMYSVIYECSLSYLGNKTRILITPVKEDGSILSPENVLLYTRHRWRVEEGVNRDNFLRNIDTNDPEHIVLDFDTSESRAALLDNLLKIYTAGPQPEPIFNPVISETNDRKHYLPITEPFNRKRGIFNRFYTEYAKWVTERNLAVIKGEVELAWLRNIDMTKKYKIGDFVGLLKSVKYSTSDNGLSIVTFELYYL